MMRPVTGALAFISMPGLVAVVVGVAIGGLGALVLLAGLGLLVAAARRRELLPAGAAATVAGLVLGLAGAALAILGDEVENGGAMDAASLLLGPLAIGLAVLAGWLVARSVRSARSRRLAEPS